MKKLLLITAVSIVLTGCGGGSSDNPTPGPEPTPPTPPVNKYDYKYSDRIGDWGYVHFHTVDQNANVYEIVNAESRNDTVKVLKNGKHLFDVPTTEWASGISVNKDGSIVTLSSSPIGSMDYNGWVWEGGDVFKFTDTSNASGNFSRSQNKGTLRAYEGVRLTSGKDYQDVKTHGRMSDWVEHDETITYSTFTGEIHAYNYETGVSIEYSDGDLHPSGNMGNLINLSNDRLIARDVNNGGTYLYDQGWTKTNFGFISELHGKLYELEPGNFHWNINEINPSDLTRTKLASVKRHSYALKMPYIAAITENKLVIAEYNVSTTLGLHLYMRVK